METENIRVYADMIISEQGQKEKSDASEDALLYVCINSHASTISSEYRLLISYDDTSWHTIEMYQCKYET